jgi:NADH/NAD ratio-sensing transcriptional regulator Rex
LFANLGLSVVSSASQSVVDGIVEHGIKKEIAETAALIAVEYGVRIALVVGGIILTKIPA